MSRYKDRAIARRAFVKDAVVAAVAASGVSGGLGALTELFAQPARVGRTSDAVAGTQGLRPLNMICLGDSVMWGQGLADVSKFSTRVREWLRREIPSRLVNRFVYARSGATIAPDGTRVEPWMNDPSLGEVPCSYPYIQDQVWIAKQNLADRHGISHEWVDLILLDGGANDVNIRTLLNPDPFFTESDLRSIVTRLCASPMAALIENAHQTFPRAKILVTGYYPIVSAQSDPVGVAALLGGIGLALAVGVPVVLGKLAEQSDAWYETSNAAFQWAVDTFNRHASVNRLDPAYRTYPASFAQVSWSPLNSYAARDTYLWNVIGITNWPDEVADARQVHCTQAGQVANPLCRDASMGHPNTAGAGAYTAACISQLRQYLPEWRGDKMMSACVEMDPKPAAGTPTTLTVHATERGMSEKAVPATVRIGSTTFPTDTPVPLALCSEQATSTVDQSGARPVTVTDTVTVCAPITVSAPGYVDVVITNYMSAVPAQ
jgi:hypothetical protein